MAEKLGSANPKKRLEKYGEEIRKFREEITCPLCLDIFEDPKILPCQHVYCKAPCLEELARHSPNPGTVTCPECRSVAQIPGNNLDNLPTAFHINRLKEVHETMAGTLSVIDSSNEMCQCSRHQSQSLDLYCESCQQLICRDCIVADRKHVDHTYGYVNEVIASHREDVRRKLNPTKQLEEDLSTAVTRISNIKVEVIEQGASHSRDIDTAFDALIDVLHEQRQSLKQNVQEIVERKTMALALQEQQLQAAKAEVTHLTETPERAVDSDSDVKFLPNEAEKIEEITQRFSHLSLDPVDHPNIGVQITLPEEMRKLFKSSSFTYSLAEPLWCTAMGDCLHRAKIGQINLFTVYLAGSQGHPCIGRQNLTVGLKSVRDGAITPVKIIAKPTSCYKVSFKPERRGRHELSVKVNGSHILSSPFSVFVMKPPRQMTVPIITAASSYPASVMYNDEKIYISTFYNGMLSSVNVWLKNAQTIIDGLCKPTEIATDRHSNIYVSTVGDHKLHKYTKDGRHVKSVGGYGTAPGWFDTPNGIRVSRDDKVFVSDSRNHRIQVFDTDLNFVKVFGRNGSGNGQFNHPNGIMFDKSGVMYVADVLNHRIEVLTQDGKYLHTIGKEGSAPGELKKPCRLTILDDIMYITEFGNNRVSVFHTSGRFITTFGEAYLHEPAGIAVDEDGFVYVTNDGKNVVVF